MKIALDAQLLFEKQKTGIGWNTKMIIDNMEPGPGDEIWLNYSSLYDTEKKRAILEAYSSRGYRLNRSGVSFWTKVYRRLGGRKGAAYSRTFSGRADVTLFFNYEIPAGVKGKTAVFVYDMTPKAYPETMNVETAAWLDKVLENSCNRADCIITISEFSKSEIIKYLGVDENKIRVVPCGVDMERYHPNHDVSRIEETKSKYHIRGGYLLYLGTLEPRKNLSVLIDAYHLLKQQDPGAPQLVIAGKKGWLYKEIFAKVQQYGLKDQVVFTGYVSEEEAPLLMQGADAFLFPSLYEGFGIPPLEAMASGTPVVVSDRASLPEVVGDAGIFVPADSAEGIMLGIKRLLKDGGMQRELASKGIERASRYTWKNSAARVLDICHTIVKG